MWDGDKYTLCQNGVDFQLVEIRNCFFIPFPCVIHEIQLVLLEPKLLHERVGHFSLRMLHQTVKAGVVRDPPDMKSFHLGSCCDTCALMKSTPTPFKLPSRELCKLPGDVMLWKLLDPTRGR